MEATDESSGEYEQRAVDLSLDGSTSDVEPREPEQAEAIRQQYPRVILSQTYLDVPYVTAPVFQYSPSLPQLFSGNLAGTIDAYNAAAEPLGGEIVADHERDEGQHVTETEWSQVRQRQLLPLVVPIEEELERLRQNFQDQPAVVDSWEVERNKRQLALQARKTAVGVPEKWVGKNKREELQKHLVDYERRRADLERRENDAGAQDKDRTLFHSEWGTLYEERKELERLKTALASIEQEDREIADETARISEARVHIAERQRLLDQMSKVCNEVRVYIEQNYF